MGTIAADAGGPEGALDRVTARDYLAALERLMILEDLPDWGSRLRSKARFRAAAVRHFSDPCLAMAARGASPTSLAKDLTYVGRLFESLALRDLRIYTQAIGGRLRHFRDSNGIDVDVIVELSDGRWAAMEIKLGPQKVDAASATLRKFADLVDTRWAGEPAFLGVVTATGYAYRRHDGVFVLPIGTLGP